MRRSTLAAALACLLCATTARSTSLTPRLPLALYGDESVATTDDARAMLFNPAALGLRYPSELFAGYARHDPHREWNTTLFSHGGFGLLALRQRDTSQTYGVSLAVGSECLRFGFASTWLMSGQPVRETVADHRIGVLTRPAPWLSGGFAIDHAFQPLFRGERLARHYTLGLGLRPLALSRESAHAWGSRLTLSSDVVLVDDGEWRQARVRTGAELEVVPGLSLRVMAEDHRNLKLGVSLRGVRFGAHAGGAQEDGHPLYQNYALSLHSGEERTAFAGAGARRVAVVRAAGRLSDEVLGGFSLLGNESTVPAKPIQRQLERALDDPLTRGVLLDLRGVRGMAQLEELRPRIARLRAAGKPVVAYMEYGGGRGDLYLASACDRVVATEPAQFEGLGVRAERRYYHKALADLGVKFDRSSVGAFKSAFRNLSVDATPRADSLDLERQLDTVQELFAGAVAQGRGLSRTRLDGVLDGRAWRSRDLQSAGVIDSVGWREDALRVLGRLAGLGDRPRTVNLERARVARRDWTVPTRIAVVYAGGGIDVGRSGNDLLLGPTMGNETVIAELERAFHAPGVRAVVLRIESGGGSTLASELIAHAIQRLRRETGRPLVVSMGSVAASGGYAIACHADRIFADRWTVTGSIGVLYVKPSLEGFYAKHGVREDDFERGPWMGGWSEARDWTPAMQAAADSAVHREYDRFVTSVAEGRRLPIATVAERAQGRVWLGDDARERGLVDEIGGLDAAILYARRRTGLPTAETIRLLELGRPRPGFIERWIGNAVGGALERDASLRGLQGLQMRADDVVPSLTE